MDTSILGRHKSFPPPIYTHTHTPLIAVVLSTIGPALGVEWCRERLPFAETADVDIPGALL